MDNTFALQPEEVSASTGLQENTVTESGDTRTSEEPDTPLQLMDQELVELIGKQDSLTLTERAELNEFRKKEKQEAKKEEAMAMERPYKLRSLKDKDLWTMLRILRKMNLKKYTQAFIALATQEKTIHEVGSVVLAELVNLFIENIPSAHDEIYAFWSELSEIPVADIEEMEFGTLPLMIMDTFNNAKGASFFKVLSKLL